MIWHGIYIYDIYMINDIYMLCIYIYIYICIYWIYFLFIYFLNISNEKN